MWKKWIQDNRASIDYRTDDFASLLRYVDELASHKLGYPVSLLTYLGVVDNRVLGIMPGTLANVLLNNVGDPFKDSETSLLEVKKHEREIIHILEKYYGMQQDELKGYVTTGGTEGNFASLWWSKRFLINSLLNKLIATDDLIKLQTTEEQEIFVNLAKIPNNEYQTRIAQLQKIIDIRNNINTNKNLIQQLLTPTVFYSKGPTHYSIPKISEILRLNIRPVNANDDGSINLNDLKKELLFHLGAHPHSAIIVIANIGTTITGAIDDVVGIRKVLEEIKPKPIYTIHMDGALTGFVLPIIKPFGDVDNYFEAIGVNTLAVSAHKYPGLSQPCGIILASKKFFDVAFEKNERSIEYVGNILDVTITGSRSGLNVLMFYNALCVLGMDTGIDILTKMVKENLATANYLYQQLVKLYGTDKVYYPHHFNVLFPKPSKALAKKYQLMITGERATICVLTNVTKKLVDQFVMDLKKDKETVMVENTKVDCTVQTLQEAHMKAVTELFVKTFCDSEPLTKYLNVHYDEYKPFANEVVHKAVKEGLSKVAIDKQGKIIACAIAEDLADPFVPHIAHYAKLKPIFALLRELSKPFMEGKKFQPKKILHLWIALVDPAYRGQGLSTMIDMACIEAAARKGFDFAYTEFTNDLSEKVIKQFKILKLYNRINYEDFNTQGEKPFTSLKGSAASYVATIRPGINLDSLSHCYKITEKY